MKKPDFPTLYPHMAGKRKVPPDYGSQELTYEQAQVLNKLVLGIFADMSNAGHSLQESLAAVYFSGVRHTLETTSVRDTIAKGESE